MSRKPVIWAYLGRKAGPVEELMQEALENPDVPFQFADGEDRARFRRRIEDAIRKQATDRQLLELADKFIAD